jgi:hypothetical protein
VNVQVNPADVWARAIIAAARSFGDDPVEAVVAPPARGRAGKRRSVAAAVLGISEAAGVPVERVAQVLGLRPSSVRVRKMRPTRDFRAAWRASARAAQYALWRPEAAESVAGSASGDLDLAGLRAAAMDPDVMVRVAEALAPAPVADWQAELAQAVEALPDKGVIFQSPRRGGKSRLRAALLEAAEAPVTEPPPHIARPHAPVAGRVNLANGHAFAPTFRPGPPPPTPSLEGRILARLAVAPGSPRGLASILDIKEAFVAQTLRNLGREGRVTAADLAPGQSDRDQAWRVA